MGSLSIRGVDPSLARLLKEKAVNSSKSVNRLVLDVLEKHVGLTKTKQYTNEFHDLDHLFGNWSEKEYQHIQSKIDAERQIDKEIWE